MRTASTPIDPTVNAAPGTIPDEQGSNRRRGPMLAALAVAAVVAAVAACAYFLDPGSDEPEPAATTAGDSGPVIVNGVDREFWPAAEVFGTLTLSDGCLFIESPDGPMVAVWPQGTTWSDAAKEVALSGSGPTTRVGAEFRGDGGYYPIENATEISVGANQAARAKECSRANGGAGFVVIGPAER